MTKQELLQMLCDPRCPGDAEILVRVVDREFSDGPHGSYRAMEIPLEVGFTGWVDGHWTILALGGTEQSGQLMPTTTAVRVVLSKQMVHDSLLDREMMEQAVEAFRKVVNGTGGSRIPRAADDSVIDAPGTFTPEERLARQWSLFDYEVGQEFAGLHRWVIRTTHFNKLYVDTMS